MPVFCTKLRAATIQTSSMQIQRWALLVAHGGWCLAASLPESRGLVFPFFFLSFFSEVLSFFYWGLLVIGLESVTTYCPCTSLARLSTTQYYNSKRKKVVWKIQCCGLLVIDVESVTAYCPSWCTWCVCDCRWAWNVPSTAQSQM